MQVDSSGSIFNQVRGTQEGQKPQQQQASAQSLTTSVAGSNDTVTITNAAALLNQIEQNISGEKTTDPLHIAQLQSALKTGDYSPDPHQVAGKLLSFEAALNDVRH